MWRRFVRDNKIAARAHGTRRDNRRRPADRKDEISSAWAVPKPGKYIYFIFIFFFRFNADVFLVLGRRFFFLIFNSKTFRVEVLTRSVPSPPRPTRVYRSSDERRELSHAFCAFPPAARTAVFRARSSATRSAPTAASVRSPKSLRSVAGINVPVPVTYGMKR